MRTRYHVIFFVFSIFTSFLNVQESQSQIPKKEIQATRIEIPPKIDGILDDPVWENVPEAGDFIQYEPFNDRPASLPTIVKFLYDDNAVYIGAMLYDPYPDSILTELGIRDAENEINADHFSIDINPYNDGVNGFTFKVSAAGVQTDVNRSSRGRRGPGGPGGPGVGLNIRGDINWDAVWDSDVKITDEGWIVEIKIPYSALRFPDSEVQTWGINFWRDFRRHTELSSWNYVDREVRNQMNYLGILKGIEGVKPPLRLSFYPYMSAYLEKSASQPSWGKTLHGGMDLKWGITESFTMDLTLIPDFGQVKSDEKILNLTPFEVRYEERRQFFTEGTELFQRANLFYSRRIGSQPTGYEDLENQLEEPGIPEDPGVLGESIILEPSETIIENPVETKMINATKISGRTNKGLGIGFLNAMTLKSIAVVRDTITGVEREILTQPFTNYNILVFDQSLPNNSYVSLINTNTYMKDAGYTANVTGTELNINDKSNMYGVRAEVAVSQQYLSDEDNIYGHKYEINIGKFGGKIQYRLGRQLVSDTYDQNDLGYLRRNNEIENQVTFDYNIFQPFGKFLSFGSGINVDYNQLYYPRRFTGLNIGLDSRAEFVNRFNIFIRGEYSPLGQKDYYEPRIEGKYYFIDESIETFSRFSTDRRKKVALSGDLRYKKIFSQYDQKEYGFELTPRFRINDKFNFAIGAQHMQRINDIGYIQDFGPDSVYFGKRNSPTWISTINSNYIFSNKISLSFDLRHYWSRVMYDGSYYFLNEDGTLLLLENDLEQEDLNYNAFTIDMVFKWNFAPGSWFTAVWKNIVDAEGNLINNFFKNLDNMFSENQVNSFSVKVLYYLDYQYINNLFGKK